MVFSSSFFILYFLPVFLTCYYLVPPRFKNYIILAASTLFYIWGAPKFVFVLFGSIALDFYLARFIYEAKTPSAKKLLVTLSVIINTSVLLYFKYANFFVENLSLILQNAGFEQISWVRVALPIGISFFTFHELSYIIDVYRGVKPPLKKITDYAVYILLFPQLVAGPIIRFNEIADQIQNRNHQINADNGLTGFFRFAIGLAKKVLIANTLGAEADRIFALPESELSFAVSWLGALAYTFQIYFDFSGYSDMAIGLALMMGFVFPENFNNPYISQSITEFWRRWHMSLSRWMRDYLYIPLGGNKVPAWRLYLNLWIVFLISGFWHGASWTFILWGAYHGFFLVVERLFLQRLLVKLPKFMKLLYAFLVVVTGWVFFRAETVSQALAFCRYMFSFDAHSFYFTVPLKTYAFFILASIGCFIAISPKVEKLELSLFLPGSRSQRTAVIYAGLSIILLLISVGYITSSDFNPFIYYRF